MNGRNMEETERWTLTEKKICDGLDAMAKAKSRHLQDIIQGPDYCDGDTGDIFLQFCLFGKVEYA